MSGRYKCRIRVSIQFAYIYLRHKQTSSYTFVTLRFDNMWCLIIVVIPYLIAGKRLYFHSLFYNIINKSAMLIFPSVYLKGKMQLHFFLVLFRLPLFRYSYVIIIGCVI